MLERLSVFLRQVAIGLRALSLRTPFDELHLTEELGRPCDQPWEPSTPRPHREVGTRISLERR